MKSNPHFSPAFAAKASRCPGMLGTTDENRAEACLQPVEHDFRSTTGKRRQIGGRSRRLVRNVAKRCLGVAVALALGLAATPAHTHPLTPVALEVEAVTPSTYVLTWKVQGMPRSDVVGFSLEPDCELEQAGPISGAIFGAEAETAVMRYRSKWVCPTTTPPILSARGLTDGPLVVGRVVVLDNPGVDFILSGFRPSLNLAEHVSATGHSGGFADYVVQGVGHLAQGLDHIAFLMCLVVAYEQIGFLVMATTAFTVGHSLSLIGVAIGLWDVPAGVTEAMIILTLIVMAVSLRVGRGFGVRPSVRKLAQISHQRSQRERRDARVCWARGRKSRGGMLAACRARFLEHDQQTRADRRLQPKDGEKSGLTAVKAHGDELGLRILSRVVREKSESYQDYGARFSVGWAVKSRVLPARSAFLSTFLACVGFGWFHGLGFGSAMRWADLSGFDLVVRLFGFNLGVEVGQVFVVAVVWAVLRYLRTTENQETGDINGQKWRQFRHHLGQNLRNKWIPDVVGVYGVMLIVLLLYP